MNEVYDRTTGAWGGVLAAMTREFNAVLPPLAPTLVYVRDDPSVCAADITVCLGDTQPFWGLGWLGVEDGSIIFTNSGVVSEEEMPGLVCHELMHAITGIEDCYFCRDDSCVHGWADRPGAFDVWYLAQFFARP